MTEVTTLISPITHIEVEQREAVFGRFHFVSETYTDPDYKGSNTLDISTYSPSPDHWHDGEEIEHTITKEDAVELVKLLQLHFSI